MRDRLGLLLDDVDDASDAYPPDGTPHHGNRDTFYTVHLGNPSIDVFAGSGVDFWNGPIPISFSNVFNSFGFTGSEMYVDYYVVPGTVYAPVGTWTFEESLASIGLTTGLNQVVFTLGNGETIRMSTGGSVPEPSTSGILASSLTLLALRRRRK